MYTPRIHGIMRKYAIGMPEQCNTLTNEEAGEVHHDILCICMPAHTGMKIPTSNITGHFMRARRDAVIGEEVTFNYMASLYTVPLLAREPIVVKG